MDVPTRSDGSTQIAGMAGPTAGGFPGLRSIPSRSTETMARFQPHGIWMALAVVAIGVIASIVIAIGPSYIMAPWDVFTLLEGGWRVFNGQIPSTDFHNPIGPLTYWLIAVGMHIAGASLTALVYGNVIFTAIVAMWSMAIFFRKLPPSFALLLTIFVCMLLAATRPLGYDPSINTYAMIYNRYGWALTSLLMIQLLVGDRSGSRYPPVFDALSSGLLLGLIFFDKISFFVFGLAALALALVLRADLRRWVGLTVIGFLLVCLGFHLVSSIDVVNYARDILLAASSQSRDQRIASLVNSIKANVVQGLVIGGLWVLVVVLPTIRHKATWRYAVKATSILMLLLASALGITVGDATERGDVPLFLIAGVILLDGWRRLSNPSSRDATVRESAAYLCASIAVIGVFFGGIFAKDALSLLSSFERGAHNSSAGPSQRFDARPLADFVVPETSDWNTAYSAARDVPLRINEGLNLLRHHITSRSRVLTLALTDPFSFALGLTAARGVPLWWDLNFSFDREHYLAPEQVFSEADYVIYPQGGPDHGGCCWQTVKILQDLYGGFLERHYVEVDHSANWVLLARRS